MFPTLRNAHSIEELPTTIHRVIASMANRNPLHTFAIGISTDRSEHEKANRTDFSKFLSNATEKAEKTAFRANRYIRTTKLDHNVI